MMRAFLGFCLTATVERQDNEHQIKWSALSLQVEPLGLQKWLLFKETIAGVVETRFPTMYY